MGDPRELLKEGYIGAISGNVTFNEMAVPIYDTVVPMRAATPYIIYSTVNLGPSRNPNRSHYGYVAAVLIDIVTSYIGGFGGTQDCLNITNQIKQLILPGTPAGAQRIDLGPSFKLVITTVVSDTEMSSTNETRTVIRNLTRFEHIIEEIN